MLQLEPTSRNPQRIMCKWERATCNGKPQIEKLAIFYSIVLFKSLYLKYNHQSNQNELFKRNHHERGQTVINVDPS